MSMVIGTRLFGRPGEIYSPVSLARNDSQITLNGSTLSASTISKNFAHKYMNQHKIYIL